VRASKASITAQINTALCVLLSFHRAIANSGQPRNRQGRPQCHLRRTHQPPLAPGSGESTVEDGRAHVQGHSWNCAVIPESIGSCRRSAWSTFPPLWSDQSSAGAAREAVYRRRPGLPGRQTHHLKQPTGQRDISPVSVNLPPAFKNISVPGLIP